MPVLRVDRQCGAGVLVGVQHNAVEPFLSLERTPAAAYFARDSKMP